MTNKREKVVIIGGGVSGVVAAMALTEPEMGGRYDVTLYQMGWRLGGKGASGRNVERQSRIEEHGLHIWFGFYDNAFTWMRRCYDELNRPEGAPLRRLEDAFKPQDFFIFNEFVNGGWRPWLLELPRDRARPGGHPSILDSIEIVFGWLAELLEHELSRDVRLLEADIEALFEDGLSGILHWLKSLFGEDRGARLHEVAAGMQRGRSPVDPSADAADQREDKRSGLLAAMARALWHAIGPKVLAGDDEARRLWILGCVGMTSLRGILADRLWLHGYDHVNKERFHDWLFRHAALPDNTPGDPNRIAFYSAPIRAFFDAAFAFEDGDTDKPNMAAGVALRGIQRIVLGYKGSVVYEMQAGMGDTVFTPFYEVLRRRGVSFEFFCRAGDMKLTPDGQSVDSLSIHRQVKLKNGYDPLLNVKGLACWPNQPLYDQIVDGERLKAAGADLSHYNNAWRDEGCPTELRAGVNFDHIVLAAALPSLPEICPEVIPAMDRWQDMLSHVKSTRTQAFQLWMTKTREQIGLPGPPAVIGSYVEPWSSITDFSHLLKMENWPASAGVMFLTYACGVMPATDPSTQKDADNVVFERIKGFLQTDTGPIWPGVTTSQGLDWSVLAAPDDVSGPDRLKCQYWRANVDSTELYQLSTAKGVEHRMKSGDTGLSNLVFAGDWTDNGFNIGSVEGAVMSGLQAARAVSGVEIAVVGEDGR